MKLDERIDCFAELGRLLRESLEGRAGKYSEYVEQLIFRQQNHNPWFTTENVRMAIEAIAINLTHEKLKKWTGMYQQLEDISEPRKVAIVMAGNIPLVGFHDLLCVLITGNRALVKTSSKDPELPVSIAELLYGINNEFRHYIEFSDGPVKNFDAVIATGSNNTSRYFEYYFSKYHHLIRKNRNSIAILRGDENSQEFKKLGEDIFTYFGLGCRNVSKIFIPEYLDPETLFSHWQEYAHLTEHSKYGNNYDYYKAVYLVNKIPFLDSGFCLMKEDTGMASPVSVIFYEYYRRDEDFSFLTGPEREKIQCIVGKGMVEFGQTQWPELWDYPDNIDTIEFILKKF